MTEKGDIAKGAGRVLMILEILAERGPLNLEQVTAHTGISRMASYRGLKTLEDQGWIRPHMGTGAFAVTAQFVNKMRRAYQTYDEIDRFMPKLKDIAKLSKIHFDVAVLEDLVVPRVVESNRRNRLPDASNFFDSPFSFVALSAEEPRMRMMVLQAAMEEATPVQQEMIRRGEVNAKIRAIGKQGYWEDTVNKSLIIPLRGYNSFSGALRVMSAVVRRPRLPEIHAIVDELQSGTIPNIPSRSVIQNLNLN